MPDEIDLEAEFAMFVDDIDEWARAAWPLAVEAMIVCDLAGVSDVDAERVGF